MTEITVDAEQLGGTTPVAEVPLHIYRGDSWTRRFTFWADADRTEPYDLDGVEVAAQVRRHPDHRAAVSMEVVVTLPNVVQVHLRAAASARTPSGRWDLQLTYPDGGWVSTVIAGPVVVTPDVTR